MKDLKFILVEESDAEFILSLRLDPVLGQHLSETNISIDNQRLWIREYKKREAENLEYYFIVKYQQKSVGTVRLYRLDCSKKECTFGTFIMHPSRPSGSTIATLNFALNFAFQKGFEKIILDVRKDNPKAISLYKYIGFSLYGETEMDLLFELKK